jgi:hypothetical protein
MAHAAQAPSMCNKGDSIAFSCPLAKGGKTVSICARAGSSKDFYYAYGKPGSAADMVWPTEGASNAGMTRTHLVYMGPTGGYAFAFTNEGFKYIVYSIEGTQFKDGGVIVVKGDEHTPIKDTSCREGAISDSGDHSLIDAALKLPEDPSISQTGLPRK